MRTAHKPLNHGRGALWVHKKHKGNYQGNYRKYGQQKNFVLYNGETKHKITFESWQAAKSLGWERL